MAVRDFESSSLASGRDAQDISFQSKSYKASLDFMIRFPTISYENHTINVVVPDSQVHDSVRDIFFHIKDGVLVCEQESSRGPTCVLPS